jgi:hypothetical protein
LPASGSAGTWLIVATRIATVAKSAARAASVGVAGRAPGRRSRNSPASDAWPRELLGTTMQPWTMAARAGLLRTSPLLMIPMVVTSRSSPQAGMAASARPARPEQ